MTLSMVVSDLEASLDSLEQAVDQFQSAELDQLCAEEELRLARRLEVLRRRLDAGTARAAGHLDRSAAFSLDGHKSAKGALKAIGRMSGAEAHGRVRAARALRELPLVAAAYERGEIPTAHVRAIARVVSNPRVAEHVAGADPIFAEHAAVLGFEGSFGAFQGAAMAETDPNDGLDGRRCHSVDGTSLRPGEALAAALVGHVRRVVVDAAGTVIDLGRRRRLFTGSSRQATMLQALLRSPGGLRCPWPGCDAHGGCLQADHREPAARGGPTDVDNSEALCGFHNRIKEHGFRPERGPGGSWTIHRPDGGPITLPV